MQPVSGAGTMPTLTTDQQRAALGESPMGRAMLKEIDRRRDCQSPAWYERQVEQAYNSLPGVKVK